MTTLPADDDEKWARFAAGVTDPSPAPPRVPADGTVAVPLRPLRGWAVAAASAVAGLTVVGTVTTWQLLGATADLLTRSRTGRADLAEFQALAEAERTRLLLFVALALLTSVCFLVWFWRVRTNAGLLDPDGQRRARPWAFWGWICPVVNLWFPLQIAQDAVDADPGPGRSRAAHLVGWWWATGLACLVVDRVEAVWLSTVGTWTEILTVLTFSRWSMLLVCAYGVLTVAVLRELTLRVGPARRHDPRSPAQA